MRKNRKIWLLVAVSFVVIGGVILGGIMNIFHWDFTKLSTVKYQTNNYNFNESFVEITAYGKSFCSICLETQKVIILKSQEG